MGHIAERMLYEARKGKPEGRRQKRIDSLIHRFIDSMKK
jgi:hypothetical protein